MKLNEILENTIPQGYAVGSFSPRYVGMIRPVLEAAQECASPAIVQISQKELNLYGITPKQFAAEFFQQKKELRITVPTTLHLDHTKDFSVIEDAIAAGFESVMIDASEKPFDENAELSRKVVEYAHARGVSVEAELGRIGANDRVETDTDSESYTDPDEAQRFTAYTGCDALAVSVGTAHGVYTVKQPTVDHRIIQAIRKRTPVYLVLHGGSGVPAEMVIGSFTLPGGGISKVNIATDLELSLLAALGVSARQTDAWCGSLSEEALRTGREAVKNTVLDKMVHYLHSNGKAW
ncbi:class II fructose-bisphosphate aldolase [Anaerotruncus rubiinfantis]|uniref:class II fructose-bisphosphate aldolase n=1 Tax=Anaerotruncus rubiinfantis TaxID=1720200 RepID=UPI00082B5E06|nr:class II fructose-bisphosphate aldolase [Anaerotruncus rubiinfantis]